MANRLEQWSKHEVRILMRSFNESDMSAEKCIVRQPTFTGPIGLAERVWQRGGKKFRIG
jgi:hypothetical protein